MIEYYMLLLWGEMRDMAEMKQWRGSKKDVLYSQPQAFLMFIFNSPSGISYVKEGSYLKALLPILYVFLSFKVI